MTTTVAYIVEMTEYERGWGCRPDGYLAFTDKAHADEHTTRIYAARNTHDVPDIYIDYEHVGYRDCSQKFLDRLADATNNGEREFVYVDSLRELTA